MPYAPEEDPSGDVRHNWDIETVDLKLVADYAGISIPAALDLNLVDYLILRKDAYIRLLMQSEKGREYLHRAWIFAQTKPDRAALRSALGGGEKIGR